MKFGPMPVAEAEGAILAHSVQLTSGKLAKGTFLSAEHVERLHQEGIVEVTAARLDDDDVHENEAAQELAAVLVPDLSGLRLSPASTGRVNVRATHPGVVVLNAEAIHAVNLVNPGITVATVPPFCRLDARGLVATIKIIPYSVPRADLDIAISKATGAIGFQLPKIAQATLIETQTGEAVPSDKGRRAVETRLRRLGVELGPRVIVPHRPQDIARALQAAPVGLKLILTGSATSDAYDTAPQGLRQAGGLLTYYGMPVDPGNLLFLGQLAQEPVIGLPGCARSEALNGADWVMERVICGIDVSPQDIAGMGVGGLLKEIPSRPMPRGRIDDHDTED